MTWSKSACIAKVSITSWTDLFLSSVINKQGTDMAAPWEAQILRKKEKYFGCLNSDTTTTLLLHVMSVFHVLNASLRFRLRSPLIFNTIAAESSEIKSLTCSCTWLVRAIAVTLQETPRQQQGRIKSAVAYHDYPEVSISLSCLSSVHMHLTWAYYLNDT